MSIQIINTGTSANSGNGDSIRLAFTKVNNNFAYLSDYIGTATIINATTATIADLRITPNQFYMDGKLVELTDNNTLLIDGGNLTLDRLTSSRYDLVLDSNGRVTMPNGSVLFDRNQVLSGLSIENTDVTFYETSPLTTGGSIYFNGNSHLYIPANNNFNVGTGDFTLEWFQNQIDVNPNGPSRIFNIGNYNTRKLTAYTNNGSISFILGTDSNPTSGIRAPLPVDYLNNWVHIAVVREDNVLRMYINGQQVENQFPTSASTESFNPSLSAVSIGAQELGTSFIGDYTGYITNLRFEAAAVYSTSTFNVTTSSFIATDNTRLLLLAATSSTAFVDSSESITPRPARVELTIGGSTSTWTFDSTGTLRLPANGNIIDSNGISVLGGGASYNQSLNTFNAVRFKGVTSTGTIYQGTITNIVDYPNTSVRVDGNSSDYLTTFMGRNINSGTNASSDIVLMNDIGTDSAHYIDLGINSSNYSAAMYGVNGTNDGYLFVNGGSLSVGTQSPGTRLVFHAGGTTEQDAGGHLDTEWHFNRPVIVELDTPGVAEFLVWNTSNHPEASSFYEARNGNGGYVRLGVNSHFATYNPDDVYLYPQGPGETFHIGNTTDIKFYASTSTGNTGTALLTLDKSLQSAIFGGDVLPETNLAYDLGSIDKQWRSLYVGTATIYIGGVPISINTTSNTLVIGTSTNTTATGATNLATENFVIDYVTQSSSGLPTITLPAETGTTYKGLQVAYGGFHTNTGQSSTRNVTKVVIHKPAATTVDITDDSNSDFFQVSGLGSSDVLAMFVVIGDVNGEKPLSDIKAFAESVIDNVILIDGEEGDFRTVDAMKAAFYDNYPSLALAANGIATDFEFFNNVFAINGGVTTVREGSGAIFEIQDLGDGTYNGSGVISGGINYLPGHKIKISGEDLGATSGAASSMIVTNGPNLNWTNSGILAGNTGLEFDITVDENGNATVSNISNGGTGKSVGDTFTLPGTVFTGLSSPEDDISFEITAVDVSANDCIITVNSVDSEGISGWSVEGVAAGTELATYGPVTGTNYQVGSGFTVYSVNASTGYVEYNTYGTNYVVGDVITLPGANLTNGATPANNITITVAQVDGSGQPYQYTSTGTIPRVWRTNNINDGGNDEYDTGNYIDSSYLNQIAYNGGNTVANGAAAFGTGSSYSFVYEDSIFGLFVTGNSSTSIGTSGSGPDSGSTIISGYIYGPNTAEQTFDNAVSFINLVGTPYAGPLITFTRTDYGDEIDEISEGLHITKDDQGWLYNALEDDVEGDNTPTGSLWNNDGWDDFTNVESRTYTSLSDIWYGNFASIPGAKMIMLDETTGKYWAIEFLSWTNNNQGGGASYTRQELDLDSLEVGIRFSDGTRQTTAYVDTNVKLTAPGSRRIEEVYGYKQVSVTEQVPVNLTTTASRNSDSPGIIWINSTATTIDNIISDTDLAGITDTNTIEFSIDNTNWYVYNGGTNFAGTERGYTVDLNGATLTYDQGDTVYFRYVTGGVPVIWWDKDDLPGGSSNFRGAVIDYHAYTDDATIIGTIHIVDDDGDENITHTEVSSGSSDSENDDLWVVFNEGDIRYRRLDGESSTLKIQWSAKVFYGSENN